LKIKITHSDIVMQVVIFLDTLPTIHPFLLSN